MADGRIWLTIEAGGFVSRVCLDARPPEDMGVTAVECLAEASTRNGFREVSDEIEQAAAKAAGRTLAQLAWARKVAE